GSPEARRLGGNGSTGALGNFPRDVGAPPVSSFRRLREVGRLNQGASAADEYFELDLEPCDAGSCNQSATADRAAIATLCIPRLRRQLHRPDQRFLRESQDERRPGAQ